MRWERVFWVSSRRYLRFDAPCTPLKGNARCLPLTAHFGLESEIVRGPLLPKSFQRALHAVLLLFAAGFLALHFVHLPADFPNHSRWMDWAKYTDEGWYGDAAIRHYQLGHWYVSGDFNPAAALPVWPLLEALVFHFSGVSLVAARALTVAIFACILVVSWVLLARSPALRERAPAAATGAVVLLAVSPFCFVFTRMAILEPLLVLLTLLALLVARDARLGRPLRTVLLLGLLLPLLILTKTTAVFLLPAIAWMLFAALGYRVRPFLRVGLAAAGLGVMLWLAYFVLLVRPHFLLDYRYLFSANAYTGMTRDNFLPVLIDTVRDGMWIGSVLYPAVLAALGLVLFSGRQLRDTPLIVSLALWIGGYAAFLAYHNNLQPRYYLVVAVPMTLLLPLAIEQVLLPHLRGRLLRAGLGLAAAALLAGIVVPDALESIGYLRAPEYTLLRAAQQVRQVVEEQQRDDPTHNPLILSISGSEISLMTGLHSIDDDFGTLELPDRVRKYRPGWYVAWNQVDDDKMDALTPLFHLERVAAFPAMDDPDRNLLIVYRLDPPIETPQLKRPGKPTPKSLQTKLGQQPSTVQLEH